MKKDGRVAASGMLWLVALCGCTARPQASNTGFEGTWARDGLAKAFRSQVSILRDGEHYRFRWKLDSTDGSWQVRCDWEGRCQETLGGKRVADYTFDVRTLSEGTLRVECTRLPLSEDEKGYRYVDLLEVDPAGTTLTSYTIELDARTFSKEESRRMVLTKVSDTVADPPPRAAS